MNIPPFDPAHALRFDLNRGTIKLADETSRVVLPVDALLGLWRAAGDEEKRDFGRSLGTEIGRLVVERLGNGVMNAAVPEVVDHVAGELALLGLGNLAVEIWGRALCLTVSDSPLGQEGDALLAAIMEGVAQRALSRSIAVVAISREDDTVRLLATSAAGARKAEQWLEAGHSYGDVLGFLNRGTSP